MSTTQQQQSRPFLPEDTMLAPTFSLIGGKWVKGATVICVTPFKTLEEAILGANDQPYGLAAGIFTRDINKAMQAATALRFGAVHINETSSSRADGMPFGGVKASGHGMEGPKYTIREVTEERLITINP